MTLLAGGAHALADAWHETSHAPVTAAVMPTEHAGKDQHPVANGLRLLRGNTSGADSEQAKNVAANEHSNGH